MKLSGETNFLRIIFVYLSLEIDRGRNPTQWGTNSHPFLLDDNSGNLLNPQQNVYTILSDTIQAESNHQAGHKHYSENDGVWQDLI